MGSQKFGVDPDSTFHLANTVKEIINQSIQLAIVISGGNIFRGLKRSGAGMARTPADHIGMPATMINGIALQQAFEKVGCESRVMSAIACDVMAESYNWKNALTYLARGLVLIFVGGSGSPCFTTDTAAALRALKVHAEVVMKATKVDGIYDKDPFKYSDAVKFEKISYADVQEKQLEVMDATAIALCRENKIPIPVFNVFENGALMKAVTGQKIGTLVEDV